MPDQACRRDLYVGRTRLAVMGPGDNGYGLRPLTRAHAEIRVQLQQALPRELGKSSPHLVKPESRCSRLLRQRRRRCRAEECAHTSGNVALTKSGIISTGLWTGGLKTVSTRAVSTALERGTDFMSAKPLKRLVSI